MWNPINRTTVQTEENKYRAYSKSGPINYKKSDGTFDTIDHTFNDTTSSIGEISLMDKGIMSVGKRKGNNPTKVVGIRPDKNQHLGTQQLEFSLVNVELDSASQSFDVETDLEIVLGPAQVSQLVKANKDFKDFKVEFDIHNTGLELQNSKYSNTTTIREDFGFNLTNLGEINTTTTDSTLGGLFTQSRATPYIECNISQITNNYITTGEYSIEEEFGSSDLSNYHIDENVYPNGSSVYYKDCIILIAKMYNIEDSNINDIFVNKMCNEYGLSTIFEDNKNGQYFVKDGKKVAGYYTIDNQFYMFINTKAIPDDIKTLFQRKTFNDTSFLDITLSDFNTTITNMFNVDLTIELNTDYYEPIDNNFVFKVNNESFYIHLPTLFDENYNLLDLGTTHSLKKNNDGSYRYTKYFSLNGYLKNSHNIKYIDADLAAGTDNISVRYRSVSTARSQTNFNSHRVSSTGNFQQTFQNDFGLDMAGQQCSSVTVQGVTTKSHLMFAGHIMRFDSSGISGAVSSATLKVRGGYNQDNYGVSDVSVILLKTDGNMDGSTEAFNANSNYMDIEGFTSGWGASDVTEYSGEVVVTQAVNFGGTDSNAVINDFTLNSDARTDLQNDNFFNVMPMEYDEIYLNNFTTGLPDTAKRTFHANGPNCTTTAFRYYIEYEAESGDASGYGHKVVGVAAASISKVKGVATANIGKVIGVD